MWTVVLTILAFAVVMAAMALGVALTGRRLRGSCGGVGGAGCVCKREGTEPADCPRKTASGDSPTTRQGSRSLDVLND